MAAVDILMPERILIDPKSTAHHARFILQPLERGYGTTLGNALRRVLLSSIPGAAIVGMRVNGVVHEFQTIPGVVEDVVEIILNLKQVRLRMLMPERPVMVRFQLRGPGEWTARDIQRASSEIEILTPEQHIATLAEDASLNVELRIQRGRGYVPAEELAPELPDQMLPIDGLFTPIRQVAYMVEPFRVGHRTDYDRLILEVKTDGSITAQDAVRYAAQLLQQHLQLFFTLPVIAAEEAPQAVAEAEEREEVAEGSAVRILETPVEHLGLSARTLHRLLSLGIRTIGELVRWTPEELQRERGIGVRIVEEINRSLKELYGLRLGMSEEELGTRA